jgi:hypothetical protein
MATFISKMFVPNLCKRREISWDLSPNHANLFVGKSKLRQQKFDWAYRKEANQSLLLNWSRLWTAEVKRRPWIHCIILYAFSSYIACGLREEERICSEVTFHIGTNNETVINYHHDYRTIHFVFHRLTQYQLLLVRSLIFFILTETNVLNDNIRHRLFIWKLYHYW